MTSIEECTRCADDVYREHIRLCRIISNISLIRLSNSIFLHIIDTEEIDSTLFSKRSFILTFTIIHVGGIMSHYLEFFGKHKVHK